VRSLFGACQEADSLPRFVRGTGNRQRTSRGGLRPKGISRRDVIEPCLELRASELVRSPSDAASVFFADEPDGLRGVLLGESAQADGALTLDLQGIAADE
jgi:hypothetical protein